MNTIKQALKEAQKRWGKKAIVSDTGKDCNCGKRHCKFLHARYSVGMNQIGFFSVEGYGASWIEAFANADEKKRSDEERYAKIYQERAKVV